MAGPGDEIAGAGRHGHLRASHADRDRVVGTLKAAFVQGMLTKDEFDQRVGETLGSRTYADLAALTADLPAGLAAAQSSPPARARGRRPVLPPRRVIEVASTLYGGAWAYALFLSPNGGDNAWAPALLLQGFMVYFGILMVCISAILISRQDKRSGGQLPPPPGPRGPASWGLPPAGPGGQFPQAGPGSSRPASGSSQPPGPVQPRGAAGDPSVSIAWLVRCCRCFSLVGTSMSLAWPSGPAGVPCMPGYMAYGRAVRPGFRTGFDFGQSSLLESACPE
jgi:hypothetical protein